jgi:hypothetical protein
MNLPTWDMPSPAATYTNNVTLKEHYTFWLPLLLSSDAPLDPNATMMAKAISHTVLVHWMHDRRWAITHTHTHTMHTTAMETTVATSCQVIATLHLSVLVVPAIHHRKQVIKFLQLQCSGVVGYGTALCNGTVSSDCEENSSSSFHPEDTSNVILKNAGTHLPDYTVSFPTTDSIKSKLYYPWFKRQKIQALCKCKTKYIATGNNTV